ncbi:hypothetical protein Y032_0004g1806 [Ancylostoma ceylanicum]|uniref:Uncharacterized protein n=1 Tax=Ancylostoma ceylanicum TaxID=53326 RepID=A0A016VTW0_9BILA|nr:hypothetical protein Y032_0004g1806 [Ancylostoma ceylanicum]
MDLPPNSKNGVVEGEQRVSMFSQSKSQSTFIFSSLSSFLIFLGFYRQVRNILSYRRHLIRTQYKAFIHYLQKSARIYCSFTF